jgi:hypothetical protein
MEHHSPFFPPSGRVPCGEKRRKKRGVGWGGSKPSYGVNAAIQAIVDENNEAPACESCHKHIVAFAVCRRLVLCSSFPSCQYTS